MTRRHCTKPSWKHVYVWLIFLKDFATAQSLFENVAYVIQFFWLVDSHLVFCNSTNPVVIFRLIIHCYIIERTLTHRGRWIIRVMLSSVTFNKIDCSDSFLDIDVRLLSLTVFNFRWVLSFVIGMLAIVYDL